MRQRPRTLRRGCSSVAVSIEVSDKNFEAQEQCRGLPVEVRFSAAVASGEITIIVDRERQAGLLSR